MRRQERSRFPSQGVAIGMEYHLRRFLDNQDYKIPRLACLIVLESGDEDRSMNERAGWPEARAALEALYARESDPSPFAHCLRNFLLSYLEMARSDLATELSRKDLPNSGEAITTV